MSDLRATILAALSTAASTYTQGAKEARATIVEACGNDAMRHDWEAVAKRFDEQASEAYAAHALLANGFLCAFSTDGDAFQGGQSTWAAASMLKDLAETLSYDNIGGTMKCPNGNTVGHWSLDHADAEDEGGEAEETDFDEID